jgi:O-antigen ligase
MLTYFFSNESRFIIAPIIIGAYLSGLFYLAENLPIPLTAFQLVLALGCVIFFFKKLILRDLTFQIYGLEFVYLLLALFIMFSIIYTPEREEALFSSIRIAVLVFMSYIFVNTINNEKDIKFILIVIVGTSTIVAFSSLMQSLFNPDLVITNYLNQSNKIIRESGNEVDPNIFASNFIMPVMLLCTTIMKSKNRLLQSMCLLSLLLILLVVLSTYSRSVWVSMVVGILYIIFKFKRVDIIIYALIIVALGILLIPELRVFFSTVLERIQNIFAGTEDDSSNIRLMLGIGAIKMFFDSYFMGVGFQGFSTYFQNYYTIQQTIGVYEPHNILYTILAEIGILGFIVFLYLLYKIVHTAYSCSKVNDSRLIHVASHSLLASSISYLVFYQFYGGLTNSFIYILIGLIFATKKVSQNKILDLKFINK